MKIALRIVLGVLLVAAAIFYGWRWSSTRPPNPDELLRVALDGNAPDKQEGAALKLAAMASQALTGGEGNPLRPYLLRVLNESGSPAARVAALRGLAAILDYDVPYPDLLKDDSPQVRRAAAMAIQKLMPHKVPFQANDPPQKRNAAAEKIRHAWIEHAKYKEDALQREGEAEKTLYKHVEAPRGTEGSGSVPPTR